MKNQYFSFWRGNILKRGSIKVSLAIALSAVLITGGFFVPNNVLAAHGTTVTLNSEVEYVAGNSTDTYTFGITNDGPDSVYKITINIPSGSTFSINTATISCPSNWTKDATSDNSKAVCITDGDPANPNLLASGSSENVSFSASSPNNLMEDESFWWIIETKDNAWGTNVNNTDAQTTVDITAPGTSDNTSENWQKDSVTVSLTPEDIASGVVSTYYCVDSNDTCDPDQLYNSGDGITVNDEGINYLRYYSIDNVGNIESTKSATYPIKIDNTKPVTDISITFGDSYNSESITYVTPETEFTLVPVDDSGSGVSVGSIFYKINEGEDITYDVPFNLAEESTGEHVISYWSVDNVGNVEDFKTLTVFIDDSAPIIGEISIDPLYNDEVINYVSDQSNISVSVSDTGSGVASCGYILDGGEDWEDAVYSNGVCSIDVDTSGAISINIRATDNLGNSDTGLAINVEADTTNPNITGSSINPESPTNNNAPTITFSINDDGSGIEPSSVVISDGTQGYTPDCSEGICSYTFSGLDDGTYNFAISVADNVGNSNTDNTSLVGYIVDTQGPVTSDNYVGKDDIWQKEDQTITLVPGDAGLSGINWTKYCIDVNNTCDPAGETDYSSPVSISTEEVNYFRYASQDNAGNIQETVSRTVKIDKTFPNNVSITSPANDTYHNGIVAIEVDAEDVGGSGLSKVEFYYGESKIDEDSELPYSIDWDTTGLNDDYVITVKAIDGAGNETISDGRTLHIDNISPTLNPYELINPEFSPDSDGIKDTSVIDVLFSEAVTYTINIKSPGGVVVKSWTGAEELNPESKTWDGKVNDTETTASDGVYTIEVTATDQAGNSLMDISKTIILDTIDSDVSVGDDLFVSAETSVTAGIIEELSGVQSYLWNGLEGITFGTSDGPTTTISADEDGSYEITLTVTDKAGNVGSDTMQFTWDTLEPNSPVITSPTNIVYKVGNGELGSVDLTFTASDQAPGTALEYAYKVDEGTYFEATEYSNKETTVSASGLSDGRHTLQLKITDVAGNFTESEIITFVVDNNDTLTIGSEGFDFTTIQSAIGVASANDTIEIAAGTYIESITIDKAVSIIGVGDDSIINGVHNITVGSVSIDELKFTSDSSTSALTTIDSSVGALDTVSITNSTFDLASASAVGIHLGPNTTVNAITNVTMTGNTFNGPGNKIANPWKIGAHYTAGVSVPISNVTFSDNEVNYSSTPINLQNQNISYVTVSGNTYRNTDGAMYIWTDADSNPSGTLSNFIFSNNDIDSTNNYGLAFIDADLGGDTFDDANFGTGIEISGNSFVGIPGKYGLKSVSALGSFTALNLDATNNYWGTAVADTIISNVSDFVDYEPYYINSDTDENGVLNGILSDVAVSIVYVDDDYSDGTSGLHYFGYDAFDSVQDGIDAIEVSGMVDVSAGTYNEAIVINKPLTLRGATYNVNKNGYTVPTNYAWDDAVETIIQNPDSDEIATVVDIVSDDVVFEGFIVQSLNRITNNWGNLLRLDASTGVAHDGAVVDSTLDNIIVRNNIIGPNTNTDSQDGTKGRMGLYFASPNYEGDERGITNTLVTGNKIIDSKGNGNNVFVWGAAESYTSPRNADYTGTIIEDNEISGSHRSGIEIAGGVDGLTIRNNSIHDNSGFTGDEADNLKYGNGILVIRMGSDKTSATAMGSENLVIENNQIYNNEKNGIYFGPINSGHTISGNTINGNGWDAIRVDLDEVYHSGNTPIYGRTSNITANGNKIYSNGFGIQVIGEPINGFILDAAHDWWGDESGPYHDATNLSGTGDAVSDNVDFRPWRTTAILTNLVDEINPTVVVSSNNETSPTKTSPIPITITFSEAVTNLTLGEISTNGTASDLLTSDNTIYTVNITPAGEGAVTVNIDAEVAWDLAGNYNTAATEFSITYDSIVPTLASVSITSSNNGSSLAKVGDIITISLTADEDIIEPTVTIAGNSAVVSGSDTSWTATYVMVSGDTEGIIPFIINFTDIATNIGTQVSTKTSGSDVTFDETAPVVAITAPIVDTKVNGATVITFTDGESTTPQCSIDNSVWVTCTSETTTLSSVTGFDALSDGNFTLYFQDIDTAGNIGTTQVIIIKDTTVPSITSKTPSAGAVGIDPTTDITIIFNEDMTITNTEVTLQKGFDPVVSTIVTFVYETGTATINPSVTLDNNSTYTIALTGVTDTVGNALPTTSWVFTTSASYSMTLTTGWNLISLPVIPTNTNISAVLGATLNDVTKIETIWKYNPITETWYVYHPGSPDTSDFSTMTAGEGYWINYLSSTAGTIAGTGNLFQEGNNTPPQKTLAAGWNLIGYYQLENVINTTATKALSTIAEQWTQLRTYSNTTKQFQAVIGSDYMRPGEGYWVFMKSSSYAPYLYGPGNID